MYVNSIIGEERRGWLYGQYGDFYKAEKLELNCWTKENGATTRIFLVPVRESSPKLIWKNVGCPQQMPRLSPIFYWKPNSRGRKTHGFIRLTGIKNRYEKGERTERQVDMEAGMCVRIDGGNQPGYLFPVSEPTVNAKNILLRVSIWTTHF